jgi:hypothetical protein
MIAITIRCDCCGDRIPGEECTIRLLGIRDTRGGLLLPSPLSEHQFCSRACLVAWLTGEPIPKKRPYQPRVSERELADQFGPDGPS